MTVLDLAASSFVRQLRQAGIRPNDSLVRNIIKHADVLYQPLLDLATELELFDEDEPQMFAPLHALRLLGEMPRVEMIEPLMKQYPIQVYGEWDELSRLWATETPQIIGRLGAQAIQPLWAIADNAEWPREARTMAVVGLANAVTMEPSQRDELIAGLQQRFAEAEDTTARTNAAMGLASLGESSAYNQVMALYREGKLDKTIFAPGVARQLLLSGGEKSLTCTKHTLEERYDQHGPHE